MAELSDLVDRARGIVFDKDGTLIDLQARWGVYFATLVANLADGHDQLHRELSGLLGVDGERVVADGLFAVGTVDECRVAVETFFVARGVEADAARRRYDNAQQRSAAGSTIGPLVPLGDVVGALAELAGHGFDLGIATSDDRAGTVAELTELGITQYLTALRFGDDEVIKPDPRVLTSIAEQWSLDPDQILYVGDSANDLTCARAAGCSFVAVAAAGAAPAGGAVPEPVRATSDMARHADAVIASVDEIAAVARPRPR